MNLSIVIPLFNEEESLEELVGWIEKVVNHHTISTEIIMVDDGSSDNSWNVIEGLAARYNHVKALKFRRNYGKAAALFSGFKQAEGDVVITMDADLQDSPDEIPGLYQMVKEEGYDMVSGWKKKRYDPVSKRVPSKVFNRFARMVTGIPLHDFNCGLKAYKNEVVKSIEVYGEMHRYMPVLAKKAGFHKIGEKVVQHAARRYGTTKYGFSRARGMFDLLTISFISRFAKKPMHLFGALGTFMFFAGLLLAGWLGGQKLHSLWNGVKAPLVTESSYFYLALMAMIMGTQFFLAGFLGELITRNAPDRNIYLIDKVIDNSA